MNLLQALPESPRRVVHGFTTRLGGVSHGALASLNLAHRARETPDALEENWRRVLSGLDGSFALEDLALVEQVHGSVVHIAQAGSGPHQVLAAADGLVTTEKGVVLAIRTADCVPVLFATGKGVAAAHAGWRGVASGVVAATLRVLLDQTGQDPSKVRVAIGPHIGPDAYEVGPEVVEGIEASGVPREVFVRPGERADHVDLRAAVVHQLQAVGVERIGHVHRCTASDPDLYSHRADGPDTGRLAAVIGRLR